MRFTLPCLLASIALCAPALVFARKPKQCVSAEQAAHMPNKDVCVSAHVYDIVRLSDGTRFLDVCSPATPDAQCRFTIVSFWADHNEVGNLQEYRNQNVQIRGIVEPMRGRFDMILSHARQFHGGPPKFRPNSMLARGFDAEAAQPPFRDPGMAAGGHHRSFMNTKAQEHTTAK